MIVGVGEEVVLVVVEAIVARQIAPVIVKIVVTARQVQAGRDIVVLVRQAVGIRTGHVVQRVPYRVAIAQKIWLFSFRISGK